MNQGHCRYAVRINSSFAEVSLLQKHRLRFDLVSATINPNPEDCQASSPSDPQGCNTCLPEQLSWVPWILPCISLNNVYVRGSYIYIYIYIYIFSTALVGATRDPESVARDYRLPDSWPPICMPRSNEYFAISRIGGSRL